MSTTEVLFFSAALLIPVVGGATLLYFLSKGPKKDESKKE